MIEVYLVICIACAAVGAVIYKTIPYFRFAYPSAKVQAIGKPFIEEKEVNKLMELKSLDSFKNTINSIKDYELKGKTAAEIQLSLDEHFARSIEMLKRDCTRKLRKFFDAYLALKEGEVLKYVIKKKIRGEEIKEQKVKLIKELVDAIKSLPADKIPDLLKESYSELARLLEEGERDPLLIDASIDRENLKRLKQVEVPKEVKKVHREFVLRIVDIRNIKNILRGKWLGYDEDTCKKLLVGEGFEIPKWLLEEMMRAKDVRGAVKALEGTTYFQFLKEHLEGLESIQPMEVALDRAMLKIASELSTKNFPLLGPILKFMISKEMEIRNLKILCKGIEEGVKPERLKELIVVE